MALPLLVGAAALAAGNIGVGAMSTNERKVEKPQADRFAQLQKVAAKFAYTSLKKALPNAIHALQSDESLNDDDKRLVLQIASARYNFNKRVKDRLNVIANNENLDAAFERNTNYKFKLPPNKNMWEEPSGDVNAIDYSKVNLKGTTNKDAYTAFIGSHGPISEYDYDADEEKRKKAGVDAKESRKRMRDAVEEEEKKSKLNKAIHNETIVPPETTIPLNNTAEQQRGDPTQMPSTHVPNDSPTPSPVPTPPSKPIPTPLPTPPPSQPTPKQPTPKQPTPKQPVPNTPHPSVAPPIIGYGHGEAKDVPLPGPEVKFPEAPVNTTTFSDEPELTLDNPIGNVIGSGAFGPGYEFKPGDVQGSFRVPRYEFPHFLWPNIFKPTAYPKATSDEISDFISGAKPMYKVQGHNTGEAYYFSERAAKNAMVQIHANEGILASVGLKSKPVTLNELRKEHPEVVNDIERRYRYLKFKTIGQPGQPPVTIDQPLQEQPEPFLRTDITPTLSTVQVAQSFVADTATYALGALATAAATSQFGPAAGAAVNAGFANALGIWSTVDKARGMSDRFGSQLAYQFQKNLIAGEKLIYPESAAPQILNPLLTATEGARTSVPLTEAFARSLYRGSNVDIGKKDWLNWYADATSNWAVR